MPSPNFEMGIFFTLLAESPQINSSLLVSN
jgi:hypothetical protein